LKSRHLLRTVSNVQQETASPSSQGRWLSGLCKTMFPAEPGWTTEEVVAWAYTSPGHVSQYGHMLVTLPVLCTDAGSIFIENFFSDARKPPSGFAWPSGDIRDGYVTCAQDSHSLESDSRGFSGFQVYIRWQYPQALSDCSVQEARGEFGGYTWWRASDQLQRYLGLVFFNYSLVSIMHVYLFPQYYTLL
jgi:hypothetical protein